MLNDHGSLIIRPHPLAFFGSFNPANEELLAARKPGSNLAEVTADRTRVNVMPLQLPSAYDPHDVMAVVGPHRLGGDENPRTGSGLGRIGARRRSSFEEFDFGAHLGEDAGIAVDDRDLYLHRRALAIGGGHHLPDSAA